MQKLLTTEETADLIGVKARTLEMWRFTKRYNLPYIKSGRLVRYKEEDVLAFIESRRQTMEESHAARSST